MLCIYLLVFDVFIDWIGFIRMFLLFGVSEKESSETRNNNVVMTMCVCASDLERKECFL